MSSTGGLLHSDDVANELLPRRRRRCWHPPAVSRFGVIAVCLIHRGVYTGKGCSIALCLACSFEQSRTRAFVASGGGLLAILVAYTISNSYRSGGSIDGATPTSYSSPSPAEATAETADTRDPTLPRFRLADIGAQHGPGSEQPWVSAHPGGDVVLRAAGGSIEPYWFSIHNQPHVLEILAQYLVGLVDVADLGEGGRPRAEQVEDPFVDDPARDARLATHKLKPRNAEPPTGELLQSFVTPNELFYVRTHMWVPVVGSGASGTADGGDAHVLTVELPDGDVREYTVDELKARFPVHRVTAVMQCSGNRRADMTRNAAKTNGLKWSVGAISNAVWEGVRLTDVLADAGLQVSGPGAATAAGRVGDGQNGSSLDGRTYHVQFTELEAYGSSIPLAKAVDPRGDVLLAFGMNGDVLPRDHGYPLRVVVPGHVAARSVKWLSEMVVSEEESYSQWQRRDYKCFGPNEGANPDWDRAPAIQELPVNNAITGVWVGEDVREGHVTWPARAAAAETTEGAEGEKWRQQQQQGEAEPIALQGYAYSGGFREVTRVNVSVDGGRTWDQAKLVGGDDDDGDSGSSGSDGKDDGAEEEGLRCTTLVVKATDEKYGSQPETHAGIYNVRGNLATAWHRVRVCPRCERPGGSGSSSNPGAAVWTTSAVYGCGFQTEETTRETAANSSVTFLDVRGQIVGVEAGLNEAVVFKRAAVANRILEGAVELGLPVDEITFIIRAIRSRNDVDDVLNPPAVGRFYPYETIGHGLALVPNPSNLRHMMILRRWSVAAPRPNNTI
ncbi:hypothetical protein HK405_004172 [Cladochytrium tenue]|nr:hypothetical protein HK405_004172 [Cladochytrium tenue]